MTTKRRQDEHPAEQAAEQAAEQVEQERAEQEEEQRARIKESATTRVYHPAVDSWRDVRDEDVDDWTGQGWLTDKPDHVDDSDDPFVVVDHSDAGKVRAKILE